ncbi:hypothetical protein ACFPYI_00250 [Halomarina salina]|uniref:Uncharacterized protein n=1 Tax=Halomarina salina TaxID=1872699 RepID=A0ABD5RHF8_9EURY|nr:hypothetical protein [Halomarina salina]
MSKTTVAERLANHPKLTGALFVALIALSQVGSAAAAAGSTLGGP